MTGSSTGSSRTTSSSTGWPFDPDLREYENPWPPLVELILDGFTTSFEDDPETAAVTLLVVALLVIA